MLDQEAVHRWLAEFVRALQEWFGERLVYVNHHGSWARGEGTPNSDIDTTVVLDRVDPPDLDRYREIIEEMPEAEKLASGVLVSVAELQRGGPHGESLQLFWGRRVLHGSVDGIRTPPTVDEIVEDIRIKASSNLHVARHYLLYPHDPGEVVHRLAYPFKCCFFALQAWMLVQRGEFIGRKDDLLKVLCNLLDRKVVEVARDWHNSEQDRTERTLHYIGLLERWSSHMLDRLPSAAS